MRYIGKIDPEIFEGKFGKLMTDEVIITERQIQHIKERHPQDYERYAGYIPQILKEPDYILEANKPNSAVLLKRFLSNGEHLQLVLRIKTPFDPKEFNNSIITFSRLHAKEWKRFIKNKKVIYKCE